MQSIPQEFYWCFQSQPILIITLKDINTDLNTSIADLDIIDDCNSVFRYQDCVSKIEVNVYDNNKWSNTS